MNARGMCWAGRAGRAASMLAAFSTHPAVRWSMLVLALLLLVGHAVSPWGQLLIRTDESWPHHRVFWLVRHPGAYERGDFVAYLMTDELASRLSPSDAQQRQYVRKGMLFFKRVLGMPGDKVEVEPLADGRARIEINGTPVGETLGRDRLGRPIHTGPLSPVIPPGAYYVALYHPRSFDSRYIGYVPEYLLRGRVIPLW